MPTARGNGETVGAINEWTDGELTPESFLASIVSSGETGVYPMLNDDLSKMLKSKWGAPVSLNLLRSGPMRFGELSRAVPGISNTMLKETLNMMCDVGIVERMQFEEIPPHTEYRITEHGIRFFTGPMFALFKWQNERPQS